MLRVPSSEHQCSSVSILTLRQDDWCQKSGSTPKLRSSGCSWQPRWLAPRFRLDPKVPVQPLNTQISVLIWRSRWQRRLYEVKANAEEWIQTVSFISDASVAEWHRDGKIWRALVNAVGHVLSLRSMSPLRASSRKPSFSQQA